MSAAGKRRRGLRVTRLESCEPRLLMAAGASNPLLFEYFIDPLAVAKTAAGKDITPDNGAAAEIRTRYGFSGQGQTVAVIDSGIAYDHIALGKGYGSGKRVVGGYDFAEGDTNPYDDGPLGSHGTHVAGILGSNDPKHVGVAPGVDLVALRVFNDSGDGALDWVKAALRWVHEHRNDYRYPITTVNLSLGMQSNGNQPPSTAPFESELAQLYADGIFVAAAAGNSFSTYNAPGVTYPASSPYVVPVASLDANGNLSSFSQRNERAIAVPGRSIVSSVPDYVGNHNGYNDDYVAYSGTSMATPYLAGAAVLVRQAYWTVGQRNVGEAQIYQNMLNTADTFHDSVTGRDYRRLNLLRAVSTIVGAGLPTAQTESPGLYQGGSGAFALDTAGGGTFTFGPGGSQWIALAGDWNADGLKTVGLYNPQTGQFLLRNANSAGPADAGFSYGAAGAGWLPVVGDWNGDGSDTVGLYDPRTGLFHLRNSNSTGVADVTLGFGVPDAGWKPLAGDWNSDGIDAVGLYDPQEGRFYLRDRNTTGVADQSFRFGAANSGATAIAGDWNADGRTTVGLFNPSEATLYLRNSNAAGSPDVTLRTSWGSGWQALVGAWGPTLRTSTASGGASGTASRQSLPDGAIAPHTGASLRVQSLQNNGAQRPCAVLTAEAPHALTASLVDEAELHTLGVDEYTLHREVEALVTSLSHARLSGDTLGGFDALFAGEDLLDPAALFG